MIGKDGSFITLTYNEEFRPVNGTVVKRHLQLFVKRLRKYLEPLRIKYYGVGEYGEKTGRPHYHIIVIGWKPDPKDCYRPDRKRIVSKEIEQIWTYGNNTVGSADREAVQYVVGYVRKKLSGDLGDNEYKATGRIPPFALQSLGLGKDYALAHKEQILNRGVTRNGTQVGVPRYYLKKLLEKDSPEELEYKTRIYEREKSKLEKYGDVYKDFYDRPHILDREDDDEYWRARWSDTERRSKAMEARQKLFNSSKL